MVFYFDSSAIVKRYVPETGSSWLKELFTNPNDVFIIAQIGIVEVATAFARKVREGAITTKEHQNLLDAFLVDCNQEYQIQALNNAIIKTAIQIIKNRQLRAYDVIQLSTALSINEVLRADKLPGLTFVCADDSLIKAAQSEGLHADNPNRY